MQHYVMIGSEIHIARSASSDTALCGAVGDYGGGAFAVPNCTVCVSIAQSKIVRTAHGGSPEEGV